MAGDGTSRLLSMLRGALHDLILTHIFFTVIKFGESTREYVILHDEAT